VLLLQWKGKTVDDRAQYFQELCYSIKPLRLIRELEEDVVNGAANERAEVEEFAVDSVECSFEEISFARVFGIEQLKELMGC
jgi:hypothetical protein